MKPGLSRALACACAALIAGCVAVGAASPPSSQAQAQIMSASAPASLRAPDAVAVLRAGDGASRGSAEIWNGPSGLLIRITAQSLPPGWHGLHVHAIGKCEDGAFQSAGPHAGHGAGAAHGLLNPSGPEAGDLPNLFADARGEARMEVFTTLISLSGEGARPGVLDADGAALVIHANADDHVSQPIGGAGPRIACGVLTRP